MRKRTILAALTTTSALVVSVLAAPPSAQASTTPKAIPNTKPAWTAQAKHLGHAANAGKVQARVYLAPKGGIAALEKDAVARSTPGSATYRQFLTSSQYQATFAPTGAAVSSVRSWLTSSGLKVSNVAAHNRYVAVTGTVQAAEKAFGTSIDSYRTAGTTAQAPTTQLQAPANVSSSVLTVTGLDTKPQLTAPRTQTDAPPPAGFRNAKPCSQYYGQRTANLQADFKTPLPKFQGDTLSYAPCGYTGPQYRSAYEGNTTLDGSGVTVAVVDAYAAPTIKPDIKTYAGNHGDAAYASGQYSQVKLGTFRNQAECGPSGWYGEETLDIEAVHAMAQGADIRFYGARSCEDADISDAVAKVLDDGTADIITNSYGDAGEDLDSAEIAAEHALYLQGAEQGVSILFSSGDSGDELANTGVKSADYPASDTAVTAVGGTATAIDGTGKRAFDTAWGTDKYTLSTDDKSWTPAGYLYGSGGGTSTLFNEPDYQVGVAPAGGRQVPDVAMDADPQTGMLIGETQTFPDGVYYDEYRIGGTSLASPLFAGFTALSVQKAGTRVGLLNPTIYADAGTPVFQDVKGNPPDSGVVRADNVNGVDATDGVTYSVRTFNQDSSLKVKKGYDNATGVGVPTTKWLDALSS
jgi:subtilase family serine protease